MSDEVLMYLISSLQKFYITYSGTLSVMKGLIGGYEAPGLYEYLSNTFTHIGLHMF